MKILISRKLSIAFVKNTPVASIMMKLPQFKNCHLDGSAKKRKIDAITPPR